MILLKIIIGGTVITQLKKALYISTSILITNALVFNSNAETNTAADIISGITNMAKAVSSASKQAENTVTEEQNIVPEVAAAVAEQGQEAGNEEAATDNKTPGATATNNVAEQAAENSTVTTTEQASTNATNIATVVEKTGFIDQKGNILIAPEGTVFPAEMKDGEIYYFSRDVEKAKENLKNNTMPQLIPNALPQNGMMPNANGQQQPPMVSPMNGGVVNPSQTAQVAPSMQPQNGVIPNANGQQQSPMVSSMNGGVVNPSQTAQVAPDMQSQNGMVPNANGQQQSPMVSPMNGGVVNPSQTAQVTPSMQPQSGLIPNAESKPEQSGLTPQTNTQQEKIAGIPTNTGLDKTNQKPIMFQCYLA